MAIEQDDRGAIDLATIQAEVDDHPHGRVPRELRRRQLMALAEQLFVEKGYAAASMDELATRAGVSKPVIYDLFGAKDRLFEACTENVADALSVAVAADVSAAGTDPEARLRAGALAWFRFVDGRRPLWDALLSSSDAPATAAIDAIRTRQDGFVASMLTAMADDLGVPVDHELLGAVATAMNGAFEALARWWHDHLDHSAEELAELYTALVLPGLAALGQFPMYDADAART